MYSSTVMQHYKEPANRGRMEGANAKGHAHYVKCGDRFEIELLVVDNVIRNARFEARACAPVVAMGSVGTTLLQGLTLDTARALMPTQLDAALGGLPPAKRHAILIFLEALHGAIQNFLKKEA